MRNLKVVNCNSCNMRKKGKEKNKQEKHENGNGNANWKLFQKEMTKIQSKCIY